MRCRANMAVGRALLTANDRDVLESDEDGQPQSQSRSRVRGRITEKLPEDIKILTEHQPGMATRLRDTVCRPPIEETGTPRTSTSSGSTPDHLLVHHPVPQTGQIAVAQQKPIELTYDSLHSILMELLDAFMIQPQAGWFTIGQQQTSMYGNGADGFLNALHIPHSTFTSDPSRYGSTLYYARSNHPDASFIVVSGEPKADQTKLRNAKVGVVGPSETVSMPSAITKMSEFEEQSFESDSLETNTPSDVLIEKTYFGGHTSTYHDLGNKLQLQPIEVLKDHRSPDMANHPYEVICSNPFFKQPDGWLKFLPTEKDTVPNETLKEYAAELAAHDRLRCFSKSDDVSKTVRAEEITVQHIPDYSESFVTTNLYLPVTPV